MKRKFSSERGKKNTKDKEQGGECMYDEKQVEESLRICKEIKVYYQTHIFDNPNNIFDLDTFLPLAEGQADTNREKISQNEFERKLQEAVAYGRRIKEQEGKRYATEIAREELQQSEGEDSKRTWGFPREELQQQPVGENSKRTQGFPSEKTQQQSTIEDGKRAQEHPIGEKNSASKGAMSFMDVPESSSFRKVETEGESKPQEQFFEKSEPKKLSRKEKAQERRERKRQQKEREKEEKAERKWEEQHARDLMFYEEEVEKKKPLVLRVFILLLQMVLAVAIAYGLAFLITKYVGMLTIVSGTSMESALQDEDHLVVDKISYRFHDPERYDVVVFPFDEKEMYIKRIIGLPGETISIEKGVIYINGQELQEDYGLEPMQEPADDYPEYQLDVDEYFVLGDNRNQSKDSRSEAVGPVKKNTIVGKAIFRVYPFEKAGWLE